MHGRILATAVCGAALVLASIPAGAQYQMGMAKFEGTCFGSDGHFVVREGGYPDHIIRFTLGSGQKIHFQLPVNSTYASGCGGWPGGYASYNPVSFE